MLLAFSCSFHVQLSEPGATPGYNGITFCWAFTATVKSEGNPVKEGSVTFKEGSNVLASSVAINNSGLAGFSISTLGLGSHTITAEYSSTGNYNQSNGSTSQTVKPGISIDDVSINDRRRETCAVGACRPTVMNPHNACSVT